jgi:hypothetical protein
VQRRRGDDKYHRHDDWSVSHFKHLITLVYAARRYQDGVAVIDRYILSRCPISKQAAMPHFVWVIVSEMSTIGT